MVIPVRERYEKLELDRFGTVGHLTHEQEIILKQFWLKVLAIIRKNETIKRISTDSEGFGKEDEKAKYSTKEPEYTKLVCDVCPKDSLPPDYTSGKDPTFYDSFCQALVNDHPDTFLLKLLRARKWDIQNAETMIHNLLEWRGRNSISELIWHGESDLNLRYLKKGVGMSAGKDRLGHPVMYIKVKDLSPSDQSIKESLKNTVYLIEVARLFFQTPIEKVSLVFDIKDMSLKNIDWYFFKIFLKYLADYYPESLALVIIYSSSWVFKSVWNIIKGLLDPVVASKVIFPKNAQELYTYIDKEQLLVDYEGTNSYKFNYILPEPNENELMFQTEEREKAVLEYKTKMDEFLKVTEKWCHLKNDDKDNVTLERKDILDKVMISGKQVDSYTRARTFYHRLGILK
ncbi:hypothetical protein BB559_001837 [Furculomyces boomerangus]|uniref:CRAL-TRIO domain-containing protein n=1 Tax=Furculomyces boomerangus TaxID=61424 RepID=A0A2T9Z088_9FUNG|nr:hypothetical protein BB559_001837 [Furculomyces boomerangus]